VTALTVAASTGLLSASAATRLTTDPDDLVANLRLLHDQGFDAVDLSDLWLAPAEMTETSCDALTDALGELGMRAVGTSVIGVEVHRADVLDGGLDWARRSLATTHRLGLDHMSIGLHPRNSRPRVPGARPGWVDAVRPEHDAASFRRAGAAIAALADEAEQLGIGLSLEMHEATLVSSGANSLRLLDVVDRANVGMNPDLGNLDRAPWPLDETWYETLEQIADRVTYWHVKNTIRAELPGGGATAVPSTLALGTIDYRAALALLRQAGFDGAIAVEHYGGDALEYARQGREYLATLP
jgi:sugar phosphate isomerase/epimerase